MEGGEDYMAQSTENLIKIPLDICTLLKASHSSVSQFNRSVMSDSATP